MISISVMMTLALQKDLKPQQEFDDPFDGPAVLLIDVVQIFGLAHDDVDAGVLPDAFDGGCVGATLVDTDLLWQIMQVDGALQEPMRRCQIPLGSKQEIDCICSAIYRTVEILPLAIHFEVGFVHPPASTKWLLTPTEHCGKNLEYLECPGRTVT